MGSITFSIHAAEATFAAAAPVWVPFATGNPILPFFREAVWRWAALIRVSTPERVRTQVALGWEFVLAVVATANEDDADHGAIDAAGAPVGPGPGNVADAAIPAIGDGPAAESPLMGSLLGNLGDGTA